MDSHDSGKARKDALGRTLVQQLDYYRQRASEYDQWFQREGRYDRGAEENRLWFDEAEEVRSALAAYGPAGQILELACGTGIWTERLLPFASVLTAVDASPEMLAVCRNRLDSDSVRYIEADLFHWTPDDEYDFVFFGFWLSHVPPPLFDQFWALIRSCIKSDGRIFFVDSLYVPTSTAKDHQLPQPGDTMATRQLNDGREFEIVKVFYQPDELMARLARIGWKIDVRTTANYFLFGSGEYSG